MRLAANWQSLRNARQFAAVMQKGRVVARSKYFTLHALYWDDSFFAQDANNSAGCAPQKAARHAFTSANSWYLGLIVPKRFAKRAVTRNLVKRQIRHLVTEQLPLSFSHMPHQAAFVVRQCAPFDAKQFVSASSLALKTAIRQDVLRLIALTGQRLKTAKHCNNQIV